MSTTRRLHAIEAMTARVDLPVPRMPMSTIEASGSNTRRISFEGEVGTGVCRGVERALEFMDVTVLWSAHTQCSICLTTNMSPLYSSCSAGANRGLQPCSRRAMSTAHLWVNGYPRSWRQRTSSSLLPQTPWRGFEGSKKSRERCLRGLDNPGGRCGLWLTATVCLVSRYFFYARYVGQLKGTRCAQHLDRKGVLAQATQSFVSLAGRRIASELQV